MSILIKGMNMPTSCAECDIKRRCFGDAKYIEWLSYHPAFYEERLTNCPLVLVPPHGRLIEKNAVFDLIRSFPNVDRQLPVEFMKTLYELPTILEAERSEI